MNDAETERSQRMIDQMVVGDRKSLKEIYGDQWPLITSPKLFGQEFKKAVTDRKLKRIGYVRIRNSGRCDEYERLEA